jgi:hypothetical protein
MSPIRVIIAVVGLLTWPEWSSRSSAYPTYSKCWAKIHAYTGISEEGSLVDWLDWMRGLGRCDAKCAGKPSFT